MTLPLIIVVAAIYGATEDTNNNFGRNLLLLNLVLHLGAVVDDDDRLLGEPDRGGPDPDHGRPARLLHGLGEGRRADRDRDHDDHVVAGPEAAVPDPAGGAGCRSSKAASASSSSSTPSWARCAARRRRPSPSSALVLVLWMTDVFHMRWFGVEISAPFAALLGAVHRAVPALGRPAVVRGRDPLAPADLQRGRLRRRARARRHRGGRVGRAHAVRRHGPEGRPLRRRPTRWSSR